MKAMHFFTLMVSCAETVFSETPSWAAISACDRPETFPQGENLATTVGQRLNGFGQEGEFLVVGDDFERPFPLFRPRERNSYPPFPSPDQPHHTFHL